jgi:hypothetical protein
MARTSYKAQERTSCGLVHATHSAPVPFHTQNKHEEGLPIAAGRPQLILPIKIDQFLNYD